VLGANPESGKEIKVMEGRYGPYVSDGATHATLPKSADPKAVTLDEALALIAEKAAKGPVKKERRSSGNSGRRKSSAGARKG
jgi:DNA topoisomerase-1